MGRQANQEPAAVATGAKVRNPFALILGSFSWSLFVTRFVTLAVGGTHFAVKGKIWGARPLQALLFSPPVEEREPCAHDDYQHGKRNPEP